MTPFDALVSPNFASTTGFTAGMVYTWATTTVDTFSASVLGFVAVFYQPIIAGIMILVIVGFTASIFRALLF